MRICRGPFFLLLFFYLFISLILFPACLCCFTHDDLTDGLQVLKLFVNISLRIKQAYLSLETESPVRTPDAVFCPPVSPSSFVKLCAGRLCPPPASSAAAAPAEEAHPSPDLPRSVFSASQEPCHAAIHRLDRPGPEEVKTKSTASGHKHTRTNRWSMSTSSQLNRA